MWVQESLLRTPGRGGGGHCSLPCAVLPLELGVHSFSSGSPGGPAEQSAVCTGGVRLQIGDSPLGCLWQAGSLVPSWSFSEPLLLPGDVSSHEGSADVIQRLSLGLGLHSYTPTVSMVAGPVFQAQAECDRLTSTGVFGVDLTIPGLAPQLVSSPHV